MTPDATGTFQGYGFYADQPYYRRTDGAYFIWFYAPTSRWTISANLGSTPAEYWRRTVSGMLGGYSPFGGAVGSATVASA